MESNLTIISKEGEKIDVDKKIRNMCELINSTLENNEEETELHLNFEAEILKEIIAYCERHKYVLPPNIPKPLPDSDLK